MMFLTVVAPLVWACHAVWGLPGFPHLLGTAKYQPLIVALVVVAEIVTVLAVRRGLKGRK